MSKFRCVSWVLVGMMFIGFIGCVFMGCELTTTQKANVEKIRRAENLLVSQPAPEIKFSMDRYLLTERYVRFNDPTKMCYLYLVFIDGTWLQTTIVGKFTSTSKRLTPDETVESLGGSYYTTKAPDEMATWGSSEPAKLGMTTLGSLIETGGFMSYIYSETPLTFTNFNKPMAKIVVEVTPEERAELSRRLASLRNQAR